MRLQLSGPSAAVLLWVLAGCGHHEFEPPDKGERIEQAAAHYTPAAFDTIQWADADVRSAEGNAVYIDACRKCHGPMGRGDTEYAGQRGLDVPSLVEPDWRLAFPDSIHRVVWTGHEDGMPIFGVDGLTPRQIDAVSYYLLEVLRPDAAAQPVGGS